MFTVAVIASYEYLHSVFVTIKLDKLKNNWFQIAAKKAKMSEYTADVYPSAINYVQVSHLNRQLLLPFYF